MSKFKKGDFIRWEADRVFRSWNTFGVIQEVTEKGNKIWYEIFTFDDMKVAKDISETGESFETEIRLASKNEVENYLYKVRDELLGIVKNLKLKIKEKEEAAEDVEQLIAKISTMQSTKTSSIEGVLNAIDSSRS